MPPEKKAKPIRLGDLIRVMWKGKTRAQCVRGDWESTPGIGYANVCREARRHTRATSHKTRVVGIEIIEYRVRA